MKKTINNKDYIKRSSGLTPDRTKATPKKKGTIAKENKLNARKSNA